MSNTEEKWAIVTGGNRGLGLEVCRQLMQHGYRVVLTARDLEQAERAAASLAAASQTEPDTVRAAQLDVTDHARVQTFAEWARTTLGPLHALVNNAGVAMHGFDEQVVKSTLAVNFFGALRVTQLLSPLLVDGGSVVMVSSGMGELRAYSPAIKARFLDEALGIDELTALLGEFESAVKGQRDQAEGWPSSAYRVSKAALNALARIVAKQSPRLHVNAVCPGWVKTDMGGASASREVAQGAKGIVWAATLDSGGPNGGFFRDGKAIPW